MNVKCEITPLHENVVVEEISGDKKVGDLILSSSDEKDCLKVYRVVAKPPDDIFKYISLGDIVLCQTDDLAKYPYSRKKLFLINGNYIRGIKEHV